MGLHVFRGNLSVRARPRSRAPQRGAPGRARDRAAARSVVSPTTTRAPPAGSSAASRSSGPSRSSTSETRPSTCSPSPTPAPRSSSRLRTVGCRLATASAPAAPARRPTSRLKGACLAIRRPSTKPAGPWQHPALQAAAVSAPTTHLLEGPDLTPPRRRRRIGCKTRSMTECHPGA
jgi:hypothetical protein